MRFFWVSFKTELAIRFKSRSNMLFCLIAVIITVIMLAFSGQENQASIQVGIQIPHGEEDFCQVLQEKSGRIIEFVPADEQMMDKKILSGDWDCGLIIPDDFTKRLEALDLEKIIVIKKGPASAVYPLVEEVVCAAVIEWISPYLAQDYLHEMGVEDVSVMDTYSKWEREDGWVKVEMATYTGEPLQTVGILHSVKNHIFSGLAAIFILVWGLYLSVDLGRWLQSFAAVRFCSVCSVAQLLIPKLSASLLPVCVWGSVFFCLMGCGVIGLAALAAFMLVVMALSMVISRFPALWQSVIALIPFQVMASLLLEPVLLDTAILFPKVAAITKWFPVSLFLRAYGGEISSLCVLLAESVILIVLLVSFDYADT